MRALRLHLLLLLLCLLAPLVQGSSRILVIQSYSAGFSRSAMFEGALGRSIESLQRGDLQMDVEYLDAQRHPEDEYLDLLGSTIVAKHNGLDDFDLLLVVDDPAMDFVVHHFPRPDHEYPVIAVGVSAAQRAEFPDPARLAWVEENPPVKETVDAAMHLLPHTEKVYVLCDTSSVGGRALYGTFVAGTRELAERLPVVFMQDCSSLMKVQEKRAWVLFGWCSHDEQGRLSCSETVLHRLRDTTAMPLFSPFPHYMGHGIVGGVTTDMNALATATLVQIERCLAGESPRDLQPIVVNSQRAVFDYPQLREEGLEEKLLPAGSILMNQPVGMLRRYRQWAWWGTLIILLQGVIIAAQVTVKRVRRETQQELQQSEQVLREVIDLVPHVILATNAGGCILLANKAAARLFGVEPAELVGRTREEVFPSVEEAERSSEEDADVLTNNIERFIQQDNFTDVHGKNHIYSTVKVPFRHYREEAVLVCATEITLQMRAEMELRNQKQFFETVIENMPLAFAARSLDEADEGRYVLFNAAAENIYHVSRAEIIGRTAAEVFGEQAQEILAMDHAAVQSGQLYEHQDFALQHRDGGSLLHVYKLPVTDSEGVPKLLLTLTEDITATRQLENQLHQSQKMEAVGQLAGGVAHDFNNLLQVIQGYGELLRLQLAGEQLENLQLVLEAAGRARSLVRQLLSFSRREEMRTERVELGEVVQGIMKMLKRVIGEDLQLHFSSSMDDLPIEADASQIEQILMNLCVNARDAMPDGGRISIETGRVMLEPGDEELGELEPGSYAQLTISDTGCGIPEEIRERIFEPYFTTKAVGQRHGTGAGNGLCHCATTPRRHLFEQRNGHWHNLPHFLPAP